MKDRKRRVLDAHRAAGNNKQIMFQTGWKVKKQHPRNYLLTSIHARSFTNTQRRSHALTHAYTYAYTHVYMHTHTHMHLHTCIYTYACTCIYTHAHNSYKHVHTYMQSLNRVFPISKQSFLFFFLNSRLTQ